MQHLAANLRASGNPGSGFAGLVWGAGRVQYPNRGVSVQRPFRVCILGSKTLLFGYLDPLG